LSEHFQKTLHYQKDRKFQIPYQPSGRRVIPSGRPSVHCSFRPDDVFILTGRQTDQHHPSGRRILSVQTLHCIEKLLFQLTSVRTSQQPVWTPISTRTVSDSFQVPIKGRSINRPDVCLSWSGRTHNRYGNCMLKNCRPDVHPPWSERAKPYMEITCSGHATVRIQVLNRKDFQRNFQKILSHSCPSGRRSYIL